MRQFWVRLVGRLLPQPKWRRYRVVPQANLAALRHQLCRGIQVRLRRNTEWKNGFATLTSATDQSSI